MCRLSIKKIDGERQKEPNREALKADAPEGSVLQRLCCTKNADEKVFTGEERKLCMRHERQCTDSHTLCMFSEVKKTKQEKKQH